MFLSQFVFVYCPFFEWLFVLNNSCLLFIWSFVYHFKNSCTTRYPFFYISLHEYALS